MPRWSGICVLFYSRMFPQFPRCAIVDRTNKYRICIFQPDAPLRTAQWDRARLAQFCSCPLPQASKNAKSIRIYQKILQFNLAHLIEIIFLQIFPQSISLSITSSLHFRYPMNPLFKRNEHGYIHYNSNCTTKDGEKQCRNHKVIRGDIPL